MIEQLEVLGDLSLQIIVGSIGVQQLRQPHHAQHTLNAGGEAHPVVGTVGNFVVAPLSDGGDVLPGGVLANGGIYAAGRKQNNIRIPGKDLLHIHLIAGALGGRRLYDSQIVGEQVDNLGMVAALGNDILALVTQAVQQVYLLYAVCNLIGAAINLVAILAQCVALGLLAQQGTQRAVGVAHAAGVAVNMNKGDTGLLLQGIQVINHAALLLAHVNNHLGAGLQQGLQVQLTLAAVQLSQLGQVIVLIGDQSLGFRCPVVGNAHHHFGGNGKNNDLCQRAGNGDLGKIRGQGDLTTQRVGKGTGRRFGIGGRGRVLLPAAGQHQHGNHHDCQQNAQHLFHGSCLLLLFGSILDHL